MGFKERAAIVSLVQIVFSYIIFLVKRTSGDFTDVFSDNLVTFFDLALKECNIHAIVAPDNMAHAEIFGTFARYAQRSQSLKTFLVKSYILEIWQIRNIYSIQATILAT